MKRLLLFLTIFCASFLILEAQTITWTGDGDGINWSDTNNWDLTIIPTVSYDVIIPDGSILTIDDNAEMKSITVQGNSVITINDVMGFSNPSLFEESVIINWHYGAIGGGILTNYGTININQHTPTFYPPEIIWSTLNNEGIINLIDGFLILSFDGLLNNQATGIIDFQADFTGIGFGINGYGILNNYGIIKKSIGSEASSIGAIINNSGIIEALAGEIEFLDYDNYPIKLNNTSEGIIKGTATIDLPKLTRFTNNGTFSPGASPGTLTIIGDFTSSPSSKLAIEINGMNQGVDCDLLTIYGDAIFDGVLDVTMGLEGNINDEFIVVTTTGSIMQCTLASTATSIFDGQQYEFDVKCRNNNEVVLTIIDKALGVEANQLTDANISLFPNPTTDIITINNDSKFDLLSAEIIDLNGRIIKTIKLNNVDQKKVISVNDFASGNYFVRINSEFGKVIRRFIKL